MMKIVGILLLSLLFACEIKTDNLIRLKGLNLDYSAPNGSGELSLYIGPSLLEDSLKFELVKNEKTLDVSLPGIQYKMEIPGFLKKAQEIEISDFNLEVSRQKALVTLEKYYALKEDESQVLEDATVSCEAQSVSESGQKMMEDILHACIERGLIKFYSFKEKKFEMVNLEAQISNGTLNITGQVFSSINGKMKLEGAIEYLKEEKKIRLRADKVKFGILSVKKRFFQEMKELESENFKVQEPYLYYSI